MTQQSLKPAADLAALRTPIFPGESADYAKAREALLAAEIEARRMIGRIAAQRRALPPGPVIATDYRFIDANGDDVGLRDLFGTHDTLVSYFWMYGPDRERPCPMCTNLLGALDGNARDIMQRAALKVFGRSTVERQQAFARERGWNALSFVQTAGDDYARDARALDDKGWEYPVLAVFRRDGDAVRLFYAGEMPSEAADPGEDPRGAIDLAPLWNVLDMTPEGRGKDWYPRLAYD